MNLLDAAKELLTCVLEKGFVTIKSVEDLRVAIKEAEKQEPEGWQPIETAPKDNKVPLFLARFNEDGTIQSFDYDGIWESDYESWEMPQVYYFWASANGNVEEPTHWMLQPEWFVRIAAAPKPEDKP